MLVCLCDRGTCTEANRAVDCLARAGARALMQRCSHRCRWAIPAALWWCVTRACASLCKRSPAVGAAHLHTITPRGRARPIHRSHRWQLIRQ